MTGKVQEFVFTSPPYPFIKYEKFSPLTFILRPLFMSNPGVNNVGSNFDDQHLNLGFEIISLSSHIEIEINEAQRCQLALKKRVNCQNAHDFVHGYAHGALVLYKVI